MPEFTIDYIELARMKDEAKYSFQPDPVVGELLDLIEADQIELSLAEALRMLEISTKAIKQANSTALSEVF